MATVEDCASLECMLLDANELALRMLETSDALNRLIGTLRSMVDEKAGTISINLGGGGNIKPQGDYPGHRA